MFGLNEVVLAILQGAAGSLTSRLMERREGSISIKAIINDVVKELKAKDQQLEVSVVEMSESLRSLKEVLKNIPEFDVQPGDTIVLAPSPQNASGVDIGDVMYRLDEEIEALRKTSISSYGRQSTTMNGERTATLTYVPNILKGLDEEIAELRNGISETDKAEVRENG